MSIQTNEAHMRNNPLRAVLLSAALAAFIALAPTAHAAVDGVRKIIVATRLATTSPSVAGISGKRTWHITARMGTGTGTATFDVQCRINAGAWQSLLITPISLPLTTADSGDSFTEDSRYDECRIVPTLPGTATYDAAVGY